MSDLKDNRGFIPKISGFHPQNIGVSSTKQFGVSSAKYLRKSHQYLNSRDVTRARVFNIINNFNAEKPNLGGALPPLQTSLQEKQEFWRAPAKIQFFVAVTTTEFNGKALLFIPRPLTKSIRGFRGINRTLRARGLTVELGYSWSAVMQSGDTPNAKAFLCHHSAN